MRVEYRITISVYIVNIMPTKPLLTVCSSEGTCLNMSGSRPCTGTYPVHRQTWPLPVGKYNSIEQISLDYNQF